MTIEAITLHRIGCNRCLDVQLGEDAYWCDGDTGEPMLFVDAGEAETYLRAELVKEEGWTTDGTYHHCESCSKLFPLVDPDPGPEPVPVLPGQIPLGAE